MEIQTLPEPLALSIEGTLVALGGAICRSKLFALLASGEIETRRCGKRTLVMVASLRAYLDGLPSAQHTA